MVGLEFAFIGRETVHEEKSLQRETIPPYDHRPLLLKQLSTKLNTVYVTEYFT